MLMKTDQATCRGDEGMKRLCDGFRVFTQSSARVMGGGNGDRLGRYGEAGDERGEIFPVY
jgi:hypothetical protein